MPTSDEVTDGAKNSTEPDAKNSTLSSAKNSASVMSYKNSSVSPVKQVTGHGSDTVSQDRLGMCVDSTESQSVNESKLLAEPLSADLSESVIGITDECLLLSESLSDSVLPNTEMQSVTEPQSDKAQSDRDAISASELQSDNEVTGVQLLSDADGVAKASRPDVRPGQNRTVTECNEVESRSSDEIDMMSLENRLESLMDESDDDDVMLTDDQLLHLAKLQPESLTKSQIEMVVKLARPSRQSSDLSETQSADDAETQSADVSETQSVDESMDRSRTMTRLDDSVIPWGDRDADDEIRWTDDCSDDAETRSQSDVDGSDCADVLGRYYQPAQHETSDESRDGSATGRHDMVTVTRGQATKVPECAGHRFVRRRSIRGGDRKPRVVRVRGRGSSSSTTIAVMGGKAILPG